MNLETTILGAVHPWVGQQLCGVAAGAAYIVVFYPSAVTSETGEEVAEEVRTENPSGGTDTEGRWSEEDWRRWNARRWYDARSQESGTSETRHGTSEQGSQGGNGGERRQSVITTTATDPWSNRDPWTGWNPQPLGEHYYDGNGTQ